jgi:hypothetical protein
MESKSTRTSSYSAPMSLSRPPLTIGIAEKSVAPHTSQTTGLPSVRRTARLTADFTGA